MFLIDLLSVLKDYSGVISALVALSNFIMVFVVFKFNRKMSQSKLTISPGFKTQDSLVEEGFDLDKTFKISLLDRIDAVKGLPMKKVLPNPIRYNKNSQFLYVTLKNKGELASGNAQVTLIFRGYGSKVKGEINEEFYDEHLYFLLPSTAQSYMKGSVEKRKLFLEKKIVVTVPYIGTDEEKHFELARLNDQFRETELILIKIKANGHTYFKQNLFQRIFTPVVIHRHTHPLMDKVEDSNELRMLFGSDNPDRKFRHAYAVKGGVLEWLRNLYAGWQRLKRMM
ncbi:hypothetical protein [Exiguobacterium sp. 17-1]|uniref:hypothetical protein n=1 Tax=Exiguobacterium sp. 17-1 TaxID=2931981 RepID=UPI001FFF90B6|nr:hypothetical protein [Exiguobacterium sp. 17-1]MCK2159074.1 hypothetical protein [Exiguobacterium sp. 17-1]